MALGSQLASIDRWTLFYVSIAFIALLRRLGDGLPQPEILLLAHLLLFVLPFVAARARQAGPLGHVVGAWYPIILLMSLYTEVGLINIAGGEVFDSVIQQWEAALFGGQPSRAWIRAQPWLWLSWPMHIGYLSYYAIIIGAPLVLWVSKRREASQKAILLTMATFFLCYIVFLFFPVSGPRYGFPLVENQATQIAPAVLTQRLLNAGDAWGTAFPSSHVATALVAAISSGLSWRPVGYVFIPMAVVLTFGTVYGQFHYAIDAISGTALAAAVIVIGFRMTRRPDIRRPNNTAEEVTS